MNTLDIDWTKIDNMNSSQIQAILRTLAPKSLKYSPHVPTAKQQVFMNLEILEAFYGGAAGGGKSDALLMDALQYSDVRGYSAIIFRKTFADLVKPGALIDRAKSWLLVHDNVIWREKDRKFEFVERRGRSVDVISTLQFGYLENESDKYNYQGGEYQYIGYDELVHMSETNYRYLFSRLRRLKGVNIPLKIRGASNPPDDDQGTWVYNRFVNEKTKKKSTIFIPAGMNDNPHLDAEEYRKSLDALDPVTRARLKDGVWTITRKGNMFKREWFEFVDAPPVNRRICRFWDMAATDPEKSVAKKRSGEPDWTVGLKLSEAKGIYYIEDIHRFQKDPGDSQKEQKQTAELDGKRVKIRLEQEPGSSGIITVQHYDTNVFSGYDFKGVKTSGSKIDRANPVSALASRGKVKVVRGCRNIDAFFSEAEGFPGGAHDDTVDGLSGAYAELATTAPQTGQIPVTVGEGISYWDEESYY